MAKQDVLAQFKADIEAAQTAAAEKVYDSAFAEGVASVPASQPGITPDQEAADIAQAVAPLKEQIAALGDQLAALVAAKSEVDGKYAADEAVIQGLKGSLEKLEAVVEALKALGV